MKIYLIVCLIFLTSCSGLIPHRTFLEEMEHEDGEFFEAGVDFPVLNGDTGRTWRSKSEWRKRIPASVEDLETRSMRGMLSTELDELENELTEAELDFYEHHRKDFLTDSERIYFLRLSPLERKYYLQSRGLLEEQRYSESTVVEETSKESLSRGMSKSDVTRILGSPTKVDVEGNPWFQNERWSYLSNEKTHFVYFQAGIVESWQ